jgi:hypothetical protein
MITDSHNILAGFRNLRIDPFTDEMRIALRLLIVSETRAIPQDVVRHIAESHKRVQTVKRDECEVRI